MTTADSSDVLLRYQQMVTRLTDAGAVSDDELDELAPGKEARPDDLWASVLVGSRVVPGV